ncbi:MAG TPA: hypothetical protein DEP35_03245 [Deltaproteobacteria bacterium]|jgi:hypothetical protein|nr:hypothetical protein [Deltaproteobacteria bacterium]
MAKTYLLSTVSGFIGGLFGAYVLGHAAASPPSSAASRPSTTQLEDSLSVRRLHLIDETGKTRAELAFSQEGGPGLFFYDHEGRNRLVLGLYAPTESEYPFVVLNDMHQHAAGIFRLFGPRETPVVVLKNNGQDRSIYGLNPSSTEPFLTTLGGDGRKTDVFGVY